MNLSLLSLSTYLCIPDYRGRIPMMYLPLCRYPRDSCCSSKPSDPPSSEPGWRWLLTRGSDPRWREWATCSHQNTSHCYHWSPWTIRFILLQIDKFYIGLKITCSWKLKTNNEKLDIVKRFGAEQLYKYNFN